MQICGNPERIYVESVVVQARALVHLAMASFLGHWLQFRKVLEIAGRQHVGTP